MQSAFSPRRHTAPLFRAAVPRPDEGIFFDDRYFRILMQDTQMIFFHYDVAGDELQLSLPTPDGKRENRRLPAFRCNVPGNARIAYKLRQSLLSALAMHMERAFQSSLSLCLDLYDTGEYRWYLADLHSLPGENGLVCQVLGLLRDVQAEKLSELRLQNMSIYRKAVDHASMFVYEFDLPDYQPKVVSQNHHTENDFFALVDYLSRPELIHPEDAAVFAAMNNALRLLECFRAQQYEQRKALRLQKRDGQWVWVQLTLHLCQGGGENEAHGIGYLQLIHSQKLMEQRATLDAVTGLLNRATMEERIRQTLQAAMEPCYFFIFDVDNFKAVNDTQGHTEGDQVLRSIASIMQAHTRKTDILGRIGGDEFAALVCGLKSNEAASARAEEILQAVRAENGPAGWKGMLSLSVGIAVSSNRLATYEALYKASDRALYRAKARGKDGWCADWE